MTLSKITKDLKALENTEKSLIHARFFKTGKGEYGEGDVFIGLTVPQQRKIAKKYKDLSFSDIQTLMKSEIHEFRLTAILILVERYPKVSEEEQEKIIEFYINNTKYINNWDLIDLSAPKILGKYLLDKPAKRKILYKFARSKSLWERRIAILSTFPFFKKNKEFEDTLKLSEILLNDDHDLIHKAVGWMLRELGKIDQETEEKFLKKHYKTMPRTMLRYSIERFDEKKRRFYMKKD